MKQDSINDSLKITDIECWKFDDTIGSCNVNQDSGFIVFVKWFRGEYGSNH